MYKYNTKPRPEVGDWCWFLLQSNRVNILYGRVTEIHTNSKGDIHYSVCQSKGRIALMIHSAKLLSMSDVAGLMTKHIGG